MQAAAFCRLLGELISWPAGPFRWQVRRAQAVIFRFAEEEFQLCLRLPLVLFGRKTKALSPLQKVSMPAQAAHCLSQAHRRYFPGAEDTLQIWAQSRNSTSHSIAIYRQHSEYFFHK